jgi:hypothetical protein
MASFNISIDDTLVPGIIATATLEGKTPEAVVNEYAAALANKTCQDLKVGPYYTGPTPPQFNQDGSPYTGTPQDDQTLEEEVIITPLDEEPAPLETEVV